jgi:hypothetical protein
MWKRDEGQRTAEKKSRAHSPCGVCALFQLCREVFEAPRLNLEGEYAGRFCLARGVLKIFCANLWTGVEKNEGTTGNAG